MVTGEEYFQRTLRLKPVIEADNELMDRMRNVFLGLTGYGQMDFGDPIKFLGQGYSHIVFGIGAVADHIMNRDLHLALRLNYRMPYKLYSSIFLEDQLGAFENAFVNGPNPPPYFVMGILSQDLGIPLRPLAMITEDLTEGGVYKVRSPTDEDFALRVKADAIGELPERFFIDPNHIGYHFSNLGKKYLATNARIDL